MADFTRMSAVDADTELREMRQALLAKLADHDKRSEPAPKTQQRIHAINCALQSLAAEKPVQGKLIEHPATAPAQTRKPGRSAYGG
jgi:hypothetical protein